MNISRALTFLIASMALSHGAAFAHIIPPEELHPVAESYRRATFILNLNPVRWESVSADVDAIADHWRATDAQAL